ncbi:MAG TPA: hypothetical protein VGQ34_12405 [Sphingomicrobium sp.]|jgi:hypothetical protein|nr:hypothetical protein [Sphingomicrobium sp.]
MATSATIIGNSNLGRGRGNGIAAAIDHWIYVFMAGWFVVITLVGFVPDSIGLVAAARSGVRPPLPPILHLHALLMGSLLLLLLAQTILMARGKRGRHQRLGRAMFVLAPAIFLVWLILVPTIYQQYWHAAHVPGASILVRKLSGALDDIFLGQLRVGVLFPLFVFVGLSARRSDPEMHKRMMILAIATILSPAIARMRWLPRPLPGLMSFDLYMLLIVSPMLLWDVIRTRTVPRPYLVWIGCYAVVSIPVYALTGSAWWHAAVPRIMHV